MTDILAARSQMAVSLMFHIVFAVIGVAMPALMVIAEWRWQRTREAVYLDLAKQWAKGTAIFFAVGAVSGTVLSFELGLLWPGFMKHAGAIIGMPFSLEGLAFFVEAIFLGIYLYGFERVSEKVHLAAGLVVAIAGAASAVMVMAVNAWMNAPTGFRLADGTFTDIDPVQAMLNTAWLPMSVHMVLAAFVAVGFAVAGVHAWRLRQGRRERFHRLAIGLSLAMAAPAALIQIVSGDLLAQHVAEHQPIKLAALEGQFATQSGAPVRLGGLPDAEQGTMKGGIEIPYLLSLLAFHDPNATVRGLSEFPRDQWPPLLPVRLAWELMLACGTILAALSLLVAWRRWRRPNEWLRPRWFLTALMVAGPLGFIALEAGWIVTEVGRQPWIIYGVMRTADTVTPMPHLEVPFIVFTALYVVLSVVVALLIRGIVLRAEPNRTAVP
ncbi:MAG: cytochrome ubiquinol oxidase subunit I [Gemmatimonadota bacterium]